MTRRRIHTVNLVSRDNGIGLTTDMLLLEGMLAEAGCDVQRVSWQDRQMRRCDVAFFLELLNPRLLPYGRCTIGVFNLEWFDRRWRAYLRRLSQVWAKSAEAADVFTRIGLRSATYTGFLSRDLYDPAVPRALTCLHVQGASGDKNTPAVLEAWRRHPGLPPLTVITAHVIPDPPAGVTVLGRLPDETFARQLNTHHIHVCPSRTEGWGHYITEGLSVGGIVITVDASPMNEHVHPDWGLLVPPAASTPRGLVRQHDVDPDALAAAVLAAAALPTDQRTDMAVRARAHVAARNQSFRDTAWRLLEAL